MNASSIQSGQAPGRRLQAASLADYAPKSILALGAEPRRATAVLIEPVEEIYRMVGWQSVELLADAGPGDSVAALVRAVNKLESQFSISLWDAKEDRPRLHASDPALVDGVGQAVAVADLLSPQRVWMAGLSGGASLRAGRDALAGALCSPVATYRHNPRRSAGDLARELETLRPDVVLIVGGYEEMARHSQQQVLAMSRLVIDAAVRLPPADRPLFCFAGNGQSADAALAYWHARTAGSAAALADNVLVAPAGRSDTALHNLLARRHWQRSLEMPAMRRIASWLHHAGELRSTQWAFVQAVRLWSWHRQLPELHGLYAGTDRWLHVWASSPPSEAERRRSTGAADNPDRESGRCESAVCVPESVTTFWPAGRRCAWSVGIGLRSGRARLRTGGIRSALFPSLSAQVRPRRKQPCTCWRQTSFKRATPAPPPVDASTQFGENEKTAR